VSEGYDDSCLALSPTSFMQLEAQLGWFALRAGCFMRFKILAFFQEHLTFSSNVAAFLVYLFASLPLLLARTSKENFAPFIVPNQTLESHAQGADCRVVRWKLASLGYL